MQLCKSTFLNAKKNGLTSLCSLKRSDKEILKNLQMSKTSMKMDKFVKKRGDKRRNIAKHMHENTGFNLNF